VYITTAETGASMGHQTHHERQGFVGVHIGLDLGAYAAANVRYAAAIKLEQED